MTIELRSVKIVRSDPIESDWIELNEPVLKYEDA